MQSPLFPMKQLETFLGSYTELKHATALYAKSFTPSGLGMEPHGKLPPVPKGFVEPNLQFWYEFRRLLDYCESGFQKNGLYQSLTGWKPSLFELTRVALGGARFQTKYTGFLALGVFKDQVQFYTHLAEKELKGFPLGEYEYETLRTRRLGYMANAFQEGGILRAYPDPREHALVALWISTPIRSRNKSCTRQPDHRAGSSHLWVTKGLRDSSEAWCSTTTSSRLLSGCA